MICSGPVEMAGGNGIRGRLLINGWGPELVLEGILLPGGSLFTSISVLMYFTLTIF